MFKVYGRVLPRGLEEDVGSVEEEGQGTVLVVGGLEDIGGVWVDIPFKFEFCLNPSPY